MNATEVRLSAKERMGTLRKLVGAVMTVGLLVTTCSMGNVEAKWGAVTRYCTASGVELWYHCNGRGDDEPILYMKKGDKLTYYSTYYTGNPEQAYCRHVAWKRNGYMDVHYLATKKPR